MKRYTSMLMIALAAVLLLGACKTKRGKGDASADAPADFVLDIQHTGCRGNCQAYGIKVVASGAATYNGRRAVDMMGNYTKTLGKGQMAELLQAIKAANFWDFEDEYGGGVADLPSVITTVTMDAKTKTVNDIRFAPQALKDMEAKLEAIIGTEGWVKQQ